MAKNIMAYDAKAREIVSKMTFNEKIKVKSGSMGLKEQIGMARNGYNCTPWCTSPVKRLGVPDMRFCDGPRGVLPSTSTCFPAAMARGASFDPDLEARVGDVIGKEVRAAGGNYFGGVCINLPYNPGWGRSQEVFSADSIHMGRMAVSLVKSVQKHNVIACIKHYALNSMERKRFSVSVEADKRTEREVYLRHFKECVDAGAASVMGAYNKYQGTYCCDNAYLIRQVLEKEWGFEGFVISDFMWGIHKGEDAVNGGCDIEMPMRMRFSSMALKSALKKGKITMEQIDESCVRIIRTLLAFAEAEDPQEYPKELGQCPEHVALAKEVAEKSITLLKNDSVLPFSKNVKNIVLVGDLAKDGNTGDHGSSWMRRGNPDNVYDALNAKFPGRVTWIANDEFESKKDLVKNADAVIAVLGMRHTDEGEFVAEKLNLGGDRVNGLGLQHGEDKIAEQIGSLNPNAAIVLIGGNMIMLDPWYDSVGAILMAYYAGMRGGEAITEILFGDVNPGGKTPFVTPYRETDLPQVDWNADKQVYGYYHDYRKLDKEGIKPRLPFGWGLSYTTFKMDEIRFTGADEKKAYFNVKITNTGNREGSEVAQLYVGFVNSVVDRPVKSLMDFKKVYLSAGETVNITLTVKKEDLAYFDENTNSFITEDIDYVAYIGNSSDNDTLTKVAFHF